jgi:hypothetical protein
VAVVHAGLSMRGSFIVLRPSHPHAHPRGVGDSR